MNISILLVLALAVHAWYVPQMRADRRDERVVVERVAVSPSKQGAIARFLSRSREKPPASPARMRSSRVRSYVRQVVGSPRALQPSRIKPIRVLPAVAWAASQEKPDLFECFAVVPYEHHTHWAGVQEIIKQQVGVLDEFGKKMLCADVLGIEEPMLQNWLLHPSAGGEAHVCVMDDRVVGFSTTQKAADPEAREIPETREIRCLAIDKRLRRNGVGKLLFDTELARARDLGARCVLVSAVAENMAARCAFEKWTGSQGSWNSEFGSYTFKQEFAPQ